MTGITVASGVVVDVGGSTIVVPLLPSLANVKFAVVLSPSIKMRSTSVTMPLPLKILKILSVPPVLVPALSTYVMLETTKFPRSI